MRKEKPVSKDSLLKCFKKFDINGDGFISHSELFNMLTKVMYIIFTVRLMSSWMSYNISCILLKMCFSLIIIYQHVP